MRTHAATARLLAVAALGACAAPRPAPAPVRAAVAPARPPEVTDSAIALGRAVYDGRGTCRSCHGDEGRGTARGPSLRHTIRVEGDTGFQALIVRVVHGSPGHDSLRADMPARQITHLNYPDIRAVAAYVWSLRERP